MLQSSGGKLVNDVTVFNNRSYDPEKRQHHPMLMLQWYFLFSLMTLAVISSVCAVLPIDALRALRCLLDQVPVQGSRQGAGPARALFDNPMGSPHLQRFPPTP